MIIAYSSCRNVKKKERGREKSDTGKELNQVHVEKLYKILDFEDGRYESLAPLWNAAVTT